MLQETSRGKPRPITQTASKDRAIHPPRPAQRVNGRCRCDLIRRSDTGHVLGRRVSNTALVKHKIKRMDRLIGSFRPIQDHTALYTAVTYWLVRELPQRWHRLAIGSL